MLKKKRIQIEKKWLVIYKNQILKITAANSTDVPLGHTAP